MNNYYFSTENDIPFIVWLLDGLGIPMDVIRWEIMKYIKLHRECTFQLCYCKLKYYFNIITGSPSYCDRGILMGVDNIFHTKHGTHYRHTILMEVYKRDLYDDMLMILRKHKKISNIFDFYRSMIFP